MKGVMYHYIRKPDPGFPYFIFLHVDNFVKQIDFLCRTYRVLTHEEISWCIENQKVIPNSLILTFDDGLIDHFEYVFPVLKSRGISGCFYVPTQPFVQMKLLDVHRLHYLLGRYGGQMILEQVQKQTSPADFNENSFERFQYQTYLKQDNDVFTKEVKEIINYHLKPGRRTLVLGKIMSEMCEDERELARKFYLSVENIEEMIASGMSIGSHGHSHTLLSNLSKLDQQNDIRFSFEKLSEIAGGGIRNSFCYPYGGKLSYNSWTTEILSQLGVDFAFSVESRDITTLDLKMKYEIPRYDCNEFEFGKATKGL